MTRPDSPIEHAEVKGRAEKVDSRAVQPKLRWGAAAFAEEGDTTVEVDEAIETDVWKLSIDMPACYISIQIDSREQLTRLTEFLGMADVRHSLAPVGEFRMGRLLTTWVWDDETSGRMFVWLNRSGKHSIRAEFSRQQVDCIRSALAEATKSG